MYLYESISLSLYIYIYIYIYMYVTMYIGMLQRGGVRPLNSTTKALPHPTPPPHHSRTTTPLTSSY